MSVNIKRRKSKKEYNIFSVIAFSSVFSVVLFFALLAAFSLFIMKNHTETTLLQTFVIVSAGISTMFSAFICSYSVKAKRLIIGMLDSIFISVCEFIVLICFNNAELTWKVYFIIPITLLTAFLGCVLGINLKK